MRLALQLVRPAGRLARDPGAGSGRLRGSRGHEAELTEELHPLVAESIKDCTCSRQNCTRSAQSWSIKFMSKL